MTELISVLPMVIEFIKARHAAKRGQRIHRYYRDVAMYRSHIAAQYLNTAREMAKVHFGLPDGLF